MDKKTKLYLGIGLLGVGVYLYFKPSKNMVGFIRPKTLPKGEKGIMMDLFVGSTVGGACKHTVRAPIGYISLTPSYDPFVVGKRWFTNFEQQIKYPDGIYSLYNSTNSYSGRWAKIGNGVVTEVGTCGYSQTPPIMPGTTPIGTPMPSTTPTTTPINPAPVPNAPTTPVPVPNAPTTTPINPRGFAGE